MKYIFPEGLYSDVRIEHVFSTNINFTFRELENCKEKRYSAAFIRVYDGDIWYYASTTDINAIQSKLDELAGLAKRSDKIKETEIYKNFSTHKDEVMAFAGKEVSNVPIEDKISLLKQAMPIVEKNEYIKLWRMTYIDDYKVKQFYNSKGAELKFDYQRSGFTVGFQMGSGERLLMESYQMGKTAFSDLHDFEEKLAETLNECQEYLLNSEPVEKGVYPVVLAPIVTGVFAHECFGHKSESDFMIGDEETKKEWVLGKRVGGDDLTIAESGSVLGMGYTPYDDEGNKATKTYLIKNGILTGRLHNAASAADLGESVTGNARAINFEFEPIVRMTTTYLENGSKTLDQLISETEKGIYIKNINHGSGMSTFTLAPSRAYMIKDGKIDKPVRVSVVSGNVFESLSNIDGISDSSEMMSFVTGGCGKMDQWPLPVGFGGPYIRIKNMNVQ